MAKNLKVKAEDLEGFFSPETADEEPSMESVPVIQAAPAKRRFIIYAQQIDKYNILRKRVLLTPAVCDQCGLDLANLNGVEGEYDKFEPEVKVKLQRAVAKHKKDYHSAADDLIVDEDQIPTEFLTRGV